MDYYKRLVNLGVQYPQARPLLRPILASFKVARQSDDYTSEMIQKIAAEVKKHGPFRIDQMWEGEKDHLVLSFRDQDGGRWLLTIYPAYMRSNSIPDHIALEVSSESDPYGQPSLYREDHHRKDVRHFVQEAGKLMNDMAS